jgi:hypothetical protein
LEEHEDEDEDRETTHLLRLACIQCRNIHPGYINDNTYNKKLECGFGYETGSGLVRVKLGKDFV